MKADELSGRDQRGRAANRGTIGAAAVAALALLAMAVCGGCIWLAIPSLAYQGYKAEQPANQNGQAKSHGNSQSAQSPDDSQIE